MRTTALRALAATTSLVLVAGLATVAPAHAADDAEVHRVPADGVFRMEGSGWGHGRGMSQWGAYQAATEGRLHGEILGFYYPGTELAELPTQQVRVLLSTDTGRNLIVRATRGLTGQRAGSDPVVLPDQVKRCKGKRITRWRVRARGPKMSLDAYCKRWRKVVKRVGDTFTFANPDGFVSTQSRKVRRSYRGTVTGTKVGRRSVRVVNTVPMEQYLRPVVAAEVSPSWPREALLAQAVAARSYAAREALGRAGRDFDVYDVIRSQAYPGARELNRRWRVVREREHPRTDAAIEATAGLHVTVDGSPALTQFSSSNGGATAGSPLPHMRVAVDEWDARATRNPRRSWTDSVGAASLRRRFPSAGPIRAIEVLSREGAGAWGGRITALRVVGESRSYTVSGDSAIRSVLGVRSSMFTFTG